MTTFGVFALCALLGAVGAVARYAVTAVLPKGAEATGLLIVNASGSLLAGAALGLAHTGAIDSSAALALLAFAAGFTTLSTMAVAVAQSIGRGQFWRGLGTAALH
nr:hypothetical protein [Actinomycetota bacterium]